MATSHQLDGIGGRYFEDCNQAQLLPADFSPEAASGVAPYALNPENAARLWELSEHLIACDVGHPAYEHHRQGVPVMQDTTLRDVGIARLRTARFGGSERSALEKMGDAPHCLSHLG